MMPWLIVSLSTMMILQLSWNYYPFFSPPPPPTPPFDRSMVLVLSLRGVRDDDNEWEDENATILFTNDARESSDNSIIRCHCLPFGESQPSFTVDLPPGTLVTREVVFFPSMKMFWLSFIPYMVTNWMDGWSGKGNKDRPTKGKQ